MKQWMETHQVLRELARWHAHGVASALATVVRVQGSAYRHEGAKLAVAADGSSAGNVSGGCLEADVREVAARVIASGVAERRRYCGGSDEIAAWDLGVGCEGVVELLVEPAPPASVHAPALDALDAGHAFITVTRLDGTGEGPVPRGTPARLVLVPSSATDGDMRTHGSLGDAALDAWVRDKAHAWLAQGRSGMVVHDGTAAFVDVCIPAPSLLIASAGDDAQVLAQLAATVGFRVHVVDRRPGLLARTPATARAIAADATRLAALLSHEGDDTLALDRDDFAVVMTHDFADDCAYLRTLLATQLRYIGVLGPRARTERLCAALVREGVEVDESRLHAPVGLDIGTDGAEQVALSIVAELLAVRSGREPRSLRERLAPIHAAR